MTAHPVKPLIVKTDERRDALGVTNVADAQAKPLIVKTGERVPVTGFYRYIGHEIADEDDGCYASIVTDNMLLAKNEEAPRLGSCGHAIAWELIMPA